MTLGRYRSTPITDIGTSNKLYLYQMEALNDPIKAFNRDEKWLQSKKLLPFSLHVAQTPINKGHRARE